MSLIEKIFKPKNIQPQLRLVEGYTGSWIYHLASGKKDEALCDPKRKVVASPASVDTWGSPRTAVRYCDHCQQIAQEKNLGLDSVHLQAQKKHTED